MTGLMTLCLSSSSCFKNDVFSDFGGGGKSETSGSNGWKVDTPHDSPLQTETHPNANSGNDYSYYGKTGGRRGLSSGGKNGGAEYSPNGDELIKVAVLGAPGVGKTSIIQVR